MKTFRYTEKSFTQMESACMFIFVLLFLINSISKIRHLSFQWHFFMTLKFLIKLTGDKPCLTQKCFPIIQCLCSMH